MVILGTALLAACYMVGILIGDALGAALGAKSNVGGVGFAMMLLIASLHFLRGRNLLSVNSERGVTFWAMMYIPVVVAMAATQNVIVAFKSGSVAVLGAIFTVIICFATIALINRTLLKRDATPWQGDVEVEQR